MTQPSDPNLELNFLPTEEAVDAELSQSVSSPVEVHIEPIAERQRQISAKITIPYPTEFVWQVLTDYEALAEFIPNLAKSRRIEHPSGGTRLEQVGSQRFLRFKFSARVVLDIEEKFPHEIAFRMVEGDFNAYEGCWCLEPDLVANQHLTHLCYALRVWPKRTMPVAIIERCLGSQLQVNLLAVHQRVEALFKTI